MRKKSAKSTAQILLPQQFYRFTKLKETIFVSFLKNKICENLTYFNIVGNYLILLNGKCAAISILNLSESILLKPPKCLHNLRL